MHDPQLNEDGQLHHLLTLDGLRADHLEGILDTATEMVNAAKMQVHKLPLLRGKTIITLFFEPSTRTRTSFELAARRLSADVININVSASSTSKGESLLDTLATLEAMHCDLFVVRHQWAGAAHFIASNVQPHVHIINGGDGAHSHPTQALLDVFTMRQRIDDWANRSVLIVGDLKHSRVARSLIIALRLLGMGEIRVCGPRTLVPAHFEEMGVTIYSDMDRAIKGVNVVNMLRVQRERMQGPFLPGSGEYFQRFGLDSRRLALAADDAIVLHPGPMNRGVEITSDVADGPQSMIVRQVTNGVAVRMAIMAHLLGARGPRPEGDGL